MANDDDIRRKYKALLDDLYPGEAIEMPSTIVVGGDAPELGVDFGIVKENGEWRIPEPFRDMAEPILLREAYRAGLPAKTAKAPAMVHTCNWFAWKSIDDKVVQKKFFDTWLAAARAEKPHEPVYNLAPAWIREIDRAMDIDPRELHGLLVRYSAENERLLGKQLRYDAAEQWAFHKAMELVPVPEPVVYDLLYNFLVQQLGTHELPARQWLIERAVASPRFAASYTTKQVSDAFRAFTGASFVSKQLDVSLTGYRYAFVFFTPSARPTAIDWDALLHVPAIYVGLYTLQGSTMRGGEDGRSFIARFCVPPTAMDALLEYFSALAAHGFIATYHVYVCSDGLWTANFNCYVPHPSAPSLVVGPARDEPDLFLRSQIEYSSPPARAAAFMARVVAEGYKQIRAFLDKVTSPFMLTAARYDSWLSTLASEARISPDVARRWLGLLVDEYRYVYPDPRNSYAFNLSTSPLTRLCITTRGNITPADRTRMCMLFPGTYSAMLRGAKTPDATIFNTVVPHGQLERSVRLVGQIAPEARASVIVATPLVRLGFRNFAWFDGDGFSQAITAIERYTRAVPRLASEWTFGQFRRNVTEPVEAALNST